MNPESIDPNSLPYLPFESKNKLPKIMAIYFVLDGEDVIYVGRSVNLKERWLNHSLAPALELQNIRIAWLAIENPLHLGFEFYFIERFNPKLNVMVSGGLKDDRIRLRISLQEKELFQRWCASKNTTPSEVLRAYVMKAVETQSLLLDGDTQAHTVTDHYPIG